MYRVGDFVYVDQGPHVPYGVRRIDELQKSQSGNVEMEVMIYLRRMDVNKEVIPVADENLTGTIDVVMRSQVDFKSCMLFVCIYDLRGNVLNLNINHLSQNHPCPCLAKITGPVLCILFRHERFN